MRERIKEIMEREGMGQSQFADFIGVNRPTLSHILAGRNNPSMEVVMKIHQKFKKTTTKKVLKELLLKQKSLQTKNYRAA